MLLAFSDRRILLDKAEEKSKLQPRFIITEEDNQNKDMRQIDRT
jgi:hypothetical protein